jgi:MYXO-CTERM domain-containing protein
MDCQLNCQSKGYLDCRTNLQGGCETACTQPDGALFCDGQYMDVGSQIDQCVAALEAAFQIEVTGYANGNAQCSGGSCTANAEAGISCAQSRGDTSGSALGVLGALAAFGLALGRRKK